MPEGGPNSERDDALHAGFNARIPEQAGEIAAPRPEIALHGNETQGEIGYVDAPDGAAEDGPVEPVRFHHLGLGVKLLPDQAGVSDQNAQVKLVILPQPVQ